MIQATAIQELQLKTTNQNRNTMTPDTILTLCCSIGVTGASIFAGLYLVSKAENKRLRALIRWKDATIDSLRLKVEEKDNLLKHIEGRIDLINENLDKYRNP